jgi:lipoprotein signal peptidase
MHWGLALVLPGAFGNLFDRIVRPGGGVVDFIRMGIPPDTYWFIYNVADVYITVGVGIMLFSFWREGRQRKHISNNSEAAVSEPEQKVEA